VAGGVDDVEAVLRVGQVHALPEAGDGGGRDRDAALLLLLHPVGGGGAVVHFAELVVHTGVEQDALGGRRLAGVDVSGDADVAIPLDWRFSGHDALSLMGTGPLVTGQRARDGEVLRSGSG